MKALILAFTLLLAAAPVVVAGSPRQDTPRVVCWYTHAQSPRGPVVVIRHCRSL